MATSQPRAYGRHDSSNNNSRFCDIPTQIDDDINPIEGYQNRSLVTLSEAVRYVEDLVFNVKENADAAKRIYRLPCPESLTPDQSAAIQLYTMEWLPQSKCLYFVLNETLRNKDRTKLRPWFAYLNLILSGLFQLESVTATVYRGVKRDLHLSYPVGKTIIWWAFSSCTTDLNILDSEQFLGKKGSRTIFIIKCFTGKNISKHSRFSHEGEILLLPATKLIVTASLNQSAGLYIIELTEVPSSNILLEPPYENATYSTDPQLASILSAPIQSELDLSNKNLHDCDMIALFKSLKSNTSCISLDLSSNYITLDGAVHISNTLRTNKTLRKLDLTNNQLTDFGATNLAHGLQFNKSLESIVLRSNQVTDEGLRTFVDLLEYNQTIIYLDLSFNQITDIGVRWLTDSLVRRNHLQQLFLSDNKITDNSVSDITHMLSVNRSLTTFYLEGNQLSGNGIDYIRSATLSRNNFVLSL